MSYILEALKKSERERARGKVPMLETASTPGFSHRAMWVGILIGVGALSSLAAIAWLISLQFTQQTVPTEGGGTARLPAEQQPEVKGQSGATVRAHNSEDESARRGKSVIDASAAHSPKRVTGLSELDPAVRARIQGLSVNVLSYSEVPERRFVMLNQRIVRESETVFDDVVVKRIMPGEALLNVGGHDIVVVPD